MCECWRNEPERRPTFDSISRTIKRLERCHKVSSVIRLYSCPFIFQLSCSQWGLASTLGIVKETGTLWMSSLCGMVFFDRNCHALIFNGHRWRQWTIQVGKGGLSVLEHKCPLITSACSPFFSSSFLAKRLDVIMNEERRRGRGTGGQSSSSSLFSSLFLSRVRL